MKKIVISCFVLALLTIATNAFASIDLGTLTTSPYKYNATESYGVAAISFDYSYGNTTLPIGQAAFRIRRLNSDGTDNWFGSFNIYATSFNLDTDYGPYEASMSLSGTHHFEFTMNSYNGQWGLKLDGSDVVFHALASTTSPQPDGTVVAAGDTLANQYFSDESMQSALNAVALGWATWNSTGTGLEGNAKDGVGGTGLYQLQFTGLAGATGALWTTSACRKSRNRPPSSSGRRSAPWH